MGMVQSVDGTLIAFDRSGAGRALILVVGALCDRSTSKSVAAMLAPHFTVYEYDRRGRGSSGDTAPYSIQREIEDLDALIAGAGGSALVYGHSSGAVLALEAASHGLPVTRLAVYEPPFIVDDSRPRPSADLGDRLRELVAAGHLGDAVKLFCVEAVEIPPEVIAMMEASPTWPALLALAHTVPYDVIICGAGNAIPAVRMAKIQIPTLAVSGGASPDWARNRACARGHHS